LAFHIKTVPFEVSDPLYDLFADIVNSIYIPAVLDNFFTISVGYVI